MNTVTYGFPSLTKCFEIESILSKYKIFARIVRIEKGIAKSGCRYGITISENNEQTVKKIFKNEKIDTKTKIYNYNGNSV